MEEEEETIDFEEIQFHDFIRTHTICILLYLTLYFISFSIIRFFKTRSDNDELYAGDEDFFVYRVSIWMCCSSLGVSLGSVTLLPFSVLGSEVLQSYPDNYYLKWLNWSLIHSMWNYVFLLSNLSLFVLLPFAYFFIESQGFGGVRTKPILARIYETLAVCGLVIVLLFGIADVFNSLVLSQPSLCFSLLSLSTLSIPLIYSFVSLVGVFLLLLSAPVGFAKMFDLYSNLLISPRPTRIDRTATAAAEHLQQMTCVRRNGWPTILHGPPGEDVSRVRSAATLDIQSPTSPLARRRMQSVQRYVTFLNTIKYPIIMLLLVLLTGVSVTMVLLNTLQLMFGFRALEFVSYVEGRDRHTFGIPGALVEVVIIIYIMVASVVGLYTMPIFRNLRPMQHKTSMTHIILNCAIILLLSSALPVLARTLGITSFDLLGAYGRLNWISNFSLVWSYNVLFAAALIFYLFNKFTAPVRREILRRLALRRSSVAADGSGPKTE